MDFHGMCSLYFVKVCCSKQKGSGWSSRKVDYLKFIFMPQRFKSDILLIARKRKTDNAVKHMAL